MMKMPKLKAPKLHKNIQLAFRNLHQRGGVLCRQASALDEAVERGGGFVYFDGRGGQPLPLSSSRFLIENGLVEPVEDGLFAGSSQTFRAVPRETFEAFKAQYEAPRNG
jgi:hypothetical protein